MGAGREGLWNLLNRSTNHQQVGRDVGSRQEELHGVKSREEIALICIAGR
jgi:hypothetical protein